MKTSNGEVKSTRTKKQITTLDANLNLNISNILDLTDDFESIYDVDVETGNYTVSTKTGVYSEQKIGNISLEKNFFESSKKNIKIAIHPDDQKILQLYLSQEYFLYELPKQHKIEIDYRCLIKNKIVWYRVKIVLSGDWTKSKHVIVGNYNIDNEHYKKQIIRTQKEDEDFYKRAILTNAYSYFKINLTQNKIISQIIEIEDGIQKDYSKKFGNILPSYDEVVKITAKKFVEKTYKKSYILSLSSNNLINQFLAGNSMPEYTCYIYSSKLGWHFRKYVNYLSQNEATGDILSMTVAYNITEQIALQEEEKKRMDIINALSKDYDAIYYVNLKNNDLTPYIINKKNNDNINTEKTYKFTDMYLWYLTTCVYEDDKINFQNAFKDILTKNQLKKSFSMFFRRIYGSKYLYTEVQCVKIDEKKASDSFVMAFAEKDTAFKAEEETRNKLKKDIGIINTLAAGYSTVFYINLADGKIIPYSSNERVKRIISSMKFFEMNINTAFNVFVNTIVYEPDRKKVIKEGDIKVILEKLRYQKNCEIIFRIKCPSGPEYRQMHYFKVNDINQEPTDIVFALADRDNEIINNYIKTRLINEYSSIFYLDLDTEILRSIKKSERLKIGQFETANYKKIMQTFLPLLSPEQREIWQNMTVTSYAKEYFKDEDNREITFQINDETKTWFRTEWQVIERRNGIPAILIVYFKMLDNITAENFELNKKISSQNAELEEKQMQLEKTLVLAQSASRSKTIFLNNMSHDIRTPMNAIIGFTDLASKHLDNPEQVKNYLIKIGQSSSHLLSLINDVLDMSRIESGKMTLNEKPENIIELLNSVIDIVQNEATNKQLELVIVKNNINNPNVICDKLRLNQILINILSNAIKYSNPGGKITVKLNQKLNLKMGMSSFEFIISDTGIGMKEDFIKTIFEPFSREKSATISGIQGTGLGMTITKKIVDMMNGKISVTSQEGVGSEFTVLIDFKSTNGTNDVENEVPKETMDFTGKRLLLVEDNAFNQEIAKEVLTEIGFVIELANDGTNAVETISKSKPGYYDAVLMDIQMPIMDGYEATKKIRKLRNKKLSNIPIVAMTANAFEEDKQKAYEVGMNGHLAKPINVEKLVELFIKIFSEIK